MDKQERLDAMLDVLKYWRKPGRTLGHGRALSPWLLGHPHEHDDDWALAQAVQTLVTAEWQQARRRAHVADVQRLDQLDAGGVLRQALIAGQSQVARYTVLWAYYFQSQSSAQVADEVGVSRRQIQLLLQEGRDLLDQALMQRVAVHTPLVSPVAGPTTGEVDLAPLPLLLAPEPVVAKPKPTGHRSITMGEVEQVDGILIVGDADAAVTQYIYNTYYLPAPIPPRRWAEQVFALAGLLVLAIGYRLFALWPSEFLALLSMFALGSMLRHADLSRRCWQGWELGDRYWQLTWLMLWGGLSLWLVLLHGQLGATNAQPDLAGELWLLGQFMAVLSALISMAMVDLLRWISIIDEQRWPLAWARLFAQRVERDRWLALNSVSGFLVLVLVILSLFS